MGRMKIFKDNIHGYIRIPNEYITSFIDTPAFQRLRYVEQTSMRYLYPCARHDRFVHSLGTYFIGKRLICALKRNLESNKNEIFTQLSHTDWEIVTNTFEMACLLHDCAHAPFSHILEPFMGYYFDKDGKAISGKFNNDLASIVIDYSSLLFEDSEFKNLDDIEATAAAEHEKASALLLWKMFRKQIVELKGDPVLAMRMIMKYQYRNNSAKKKILNCVISLLNGAHIDADKLDYIVRDTVLSGIENLTIDLTRIIDSVTIIQKDGKYRIGYNKSSVSVIQNIITARNNFYLWTYTHHKALYYSELLKKCFRKAINYVYCIKDDNQLCEFASRFLCIESMMEPYDLFYQDSSGNSVKENLYLINDNDVQVLLKKAYSLHPDDKDFYELFSRVYKRSLWKSYAEFKSIFSESSKVEINSIIAKINSVPDDVFCSLNERLMQENRITKEVKWIGFQATAKIGAILESEVYIDFGKEEALDYSKIMGATPTTSPFFYLYYDKEGEPFSNKDIEIIHEVLLEFS